MRRLLARALRNCAQWIDALARWLLGMSLRLDSGTAVLGGVTVPPARRLPWQAAPAPAHWVRLVRQHAPQLLARHQAAVLDASAQTDGSTRHDVQTRRDAQTRLDSGRHDAVSPGTLATHAADLGEASPGPGVRMMGAAAAASAPPSPSPAGRRRAPVPPGVPTSWASNRHPAVASPRSATDPRGRSAPGDPPRPTVPPGLGAPPPPRPVTPEPKAAPPRALRAASEPGAPGSDPRPERHDPGRARPDRDLTEPDRERAARDRALTEPDRGPAGLDRRPAGDGPPEPHRWRSLPDQWAPPDVPTPTLPPGRPGVAARYPSLPDDSALWTEPVEPDPDTAEHLARLAGEQRGRSWNG